MLSTDRRKREAVADGIGCAVRPLVPLQACGYDFRARVWGEVKALTMVTLAKMEVTLDKQRTSYF